MFTYAEVEYLLTAAHCLVDKNNNVVTPKMVAVNFLDPHSLQKFQYKVSHLSIHPDYTGTLASFKQWDLAILKLSTKVDSRFSQNLPTLVVTSRTLHALGIPGGKFTFYGFGVTNSGHLSPHLLSGESIARPSDECLERIGEDKAFKGNDRPSHQAGPVGIFCSFTAGQGAYTAIGDSGGPAVVFQNKKNYIVGIVVSGEASKESPPVRTKSVFETFDDSKTIAWLLKFTSTPGSVVNCRRTCSCFGF